jgi:hypothetical protein
MQSKCQLEVVDCPCVSFVGVRLSTDRLWGEGDHPDKRLRRKRMAQMGESCAAACHVLLLGTLVGHVLLLGTLVGLHAHNLLGLRACMHPI